MINPKVSLLRNLTRKNDSLRKSVKKIHHSNLPKKEFEANKNSEPKNKKENIIEKEDEQAYGYNKKYKIKIFDELNNEKYKLNEFIIIKLVVLLSLIKIKKLIDIEFENKKVNKTFIIPKFQDSLIEKLRESFLKLKSKKWVDSNDFKKIKRKLIKHKKMELKQKEVIK